MKYILILFLSAVLLISSQNAITAVPNDSIFKQNIEIVSLAAKELSKTLPQKVDKYTQLTDVKAQGSALLYMFEINNAPKSDDEIVKNAKGRMQNAVIEGVCMTQERFLQAGISISYIYRSAATKSELFRFDITNATCQNIKP